MTDTSDLWPMVSLCIVQLDPPNRAHRFSSS